MRFKDTKYGDLTGKIFIGNINVSGIGLTSLKGSPKIIINGGFDCSYNQLTSLKCSPHIIRGSFICNNNQLTSLKCSPKEVTDSFICYDNHLISLEGAPTEVGGGFFCGKNKLTSFEHSPKIVGGNFNASDNQLTTTKDAPDEIGGIFRCSHNPNPHLETEYKIRKENPDLSDEDFAMKMYDETDDTNYLPQEVRDAFIF